MPPTRTPQSRRSPSNPPVGQNDGTKESEKDNCTINSETALTTITKSTTTEKELEKQRCLIAMFYEMTLEAPEPEEWNGKHETVTTIMKSLRLKGNQRNRVRRVVGETYDKIMNGLTYDGKIKYGGGRPVEIKPGSEEETMLADGKESGMSFDDVTVFINEYREDHALPLLGVNAVVAAFNRMTKITKPVLKKSQGSDDPQSSWARARNNLVTQMVLRMGKSGFV